MSKKHMDILMRHELEKELKKLSLDKLDRLCIGLYLHDVEGELPKELRNKVVIYHIERSRSIVKPYVIDPENRTYDSFGILGTDEKPEETIKKYFDISGELMKKGVKDATVLVGERDIKETLGKYIRN